ncbi:MAG: heme exporter protein CcmB [Chitinophagales bacterium]
MWRSIKALLYKDILIEWRNRYVLGGIALYVAASVLLIYFSLQYNDALQGLSPVVWSILFWLIMLFSSLNAIANSFFREPEGRTLYYYYITSPEAIILAKMLYNFLFTVLLSALAFLFFSVMVPNPVQQQGLFFLVVLLGGTSYSFLFTLMSAIASRAGGNATLIAVLGFPIIIPLLIFITRLSTAAIAESTLSSATVNNLLLLTALNLMQLILAYILFPYIWRE